MTEKLKFKKNHAILSVAYSKRTVSGAHTFTNCQGMDDTKKSYNQYIDNVVIILKTLIH